MEREPVLCPQVTFLQLFYIICPDRARRMRKFSWRWHSASAETAQGTAKRMARGGTIPEDTPTRVKSKLAQPLKKTPRKNDPSCVSPKTSSNQMAAKRPILRFSTPRWRSGKRQRLRGPRLETPISSLVQLSAVRCEATIGICQSKINMLVSGNNAIGDFRRQRHRREKLSRKKRGKHRVTVKRSEEFENLEIKPRFHCDATRRWRHP